MNAAARPPIDIVQLYPRDMNIYGDWGNVLALVRRLQWYGYAPSVHPYEPGDPWPGRADLVVGGGGQDSGQTRIQRDLRQIAPRLRDLADGGVPMLVVCGLYQLFGHSFRTQEGEVLVGAGVLDVETVGRPKRLIGNVTEYSREFGRLVGYENHSGQTFLGPDAAPLARIVRGAGNNGRDHTEGARRDHVIGTYLHGSVLPKNPALADYLIAAACERRHGAFRPVRPIDDTLARRARAAQEARPR